MSLIDKTIAIYCFVDDVLKAGHHPEDCRRRVNDAEVITTAIIAAFYFGANYDKALDYVRSSGLMPGMLEKSRFCRRLHAVSTCIYQLFLLTGRFFKDFHCHMEYALDSFPVPVCDNIRIRRCRLLKGEQWRGYCASMRRYYYGVKVQLITTSDGVPVNVYFVPASEHNSKILEGMTFDFNPENTIYADAAYTNYLTEEELFEHEQLHLQVSRKSNSKRPKTYWAEYIIKHYRKRIETAISDIKKLFPRTIHAVTKEGFLLKLMLFVFTNQLNRIFN